MFFVTYLRRELSRRMRLYGVGTNVTVTGAVVSLGPGAAPPQGGQSIQAPPAGSGPSFHTGPHGPEVCAYGKCVPGTTLNDLGSMYLGISVPKLAAAARLRGVAAAAGGIRLLDQTVTLPKNSHRPRAGGYTVYGVDTRETSLGPLSSASLVSGHSSTAAEPDSDVAVVDCGYAKSLGLTVGSAVTIDQARSAAIGIAGAAAGVGLGFAGAAIIAAVAPKLSATAGANSLPHYSAPQPGSRPATRSSPAAQA